MQSYTAQLMILYFVVDILLLFGIKRLHDRVPNIGRTALAALYGSIFAAVCLMPRFSFLNTFFWQLCGFAATGLMAFGTTPMGISGSMLYVLLHVVMQNRGRGAMLMACGGFLIWVFFFRKNGGALYIPVELNHNGRKLSVMALRDTGNCLRDPITGKPVLIIDAATAEGLTGLSRLQLGNPIETMGTIPGLRLIPYKTVGGSGFLLALRLQNVKIGSWQGSRLVAFSPEIFNFEGMYQALTGGVA